MPPTSRLARLRQGEDGQLDQKEHLLVGIFNWAAQTAYWSRVAALKNLKPHEQAEIQKKAPKPLERPGKKKKFMSPDQLVKALGGKVSVFHTS